MRDITIDLTSLDTTLYDTAVIRTGEHNASQLVITLSDELIGFKNNLIFRLNRNEPQVASDVSNVDNVITYPISNSITYEAGTLKVEIQSYDAITMLTKSVIVFLQVTKAIEGLPVEVPPNQWDDYPYGFMDKKTYDTNLKEVDVFEMDNMVEGAATKIFTDVERDKLAAIIGDVEATPATYPIRDSEGNVKTVGIKYELIPAGIREEGKTRWNPIKHTLEVGLTGAIDDALHLAQDMVIWSTNVSGYELPIGTVVAISGSSGGVISITRADADGSGVEKNVIGVVGGFQIPIGGQGYVVLGGIITNMNTIDFEEGDVIYLSDEIGRLTNIKPSVPAAIIALGWCIKKAGGTLGELYIHVDKIYPADEIVLIDTDDHFISENVEGALAELAEKTTAAYGEIFIYNGGAPQTIPTGDTYTKLTPFMAAGETLNTTSDAGNQQIIIGRTGDYKLTSTLSSSLGSNGNVLDTAFFLNGLEVQKAHVVRKLVTAGEASTGGATCILCLEIGDILDIRVKHDRISSVDITVQYGNFNVQRIVG